MDTFEHLKQEFVNNRITRRGLIQRSALAGISLTAVGAFLAACSKPETPAPAGGTTTPPAETPAPAATGPKFGGLAKTWAGSTLNVSLVAEGRSDALKKKLKEFTDATGINVNIDIYPYPTLEEKQFTAISQGSGNIDIVHVDCVWMGQYGGQGWLHPVTDFVKETDPAVLDLEDFMPRVLSEQSMWEDTLYGLPFIDAVFTLYYRKDIFEKHSRKPPETWDELRETARTIHEQEKANGISGLTMMAKRGVQLVCTHLNVLGSYGGFYYDQNYNPTMNTPESIAAIEYLKSLLPYCNDGVLSQDYDESAATFQQGRAAMNLQWQNAAPMFVDPAKSQIIGKWDIYTIPGVSKGGSVYRTPTFGGWDMGIVADSKNKEAAWEFIVWATTKQMEKELASASPGARRSTLSDPELAKTYIEYPVMIKSLDVALGRPRIPVWTQMNDVLGAALSSVMVGEKDARSAMDQLNSQFADILKSGGYLK